MADVDGLIRFMFLVVGVAGAAHFLTMCDATQRAPLWFKYGALILLPTIFVGVVTCAFYPGVVAIVTGLLMTLTACALMLVVWLRAWVAGMHVSTAMDREASERALYAADAVRRVLDDAAAKAKREGQIVTVSTWDKLQEMEQAERAGKDGRSHGL